MKKMKKMKKMFSCMLAAAMMLSLLCAVPAQAAPTENYPYVFEDYETGVGKTTMSGITTWAEGEGANGSNGSLFVKLTGDLNQDIAVSCTRAPQKNAKLKFSAWVKMDNTEVKTDTVSFIVYGNVRFPKTDATLAGEDAPDSIVKSGWIQVDARNAGLKKGEWVYVTATHSWNGALTAFPTKGYGGVTADTATASSTDIIDFTRLALRVAGGGKNGAAEEVSSVNYYIDDITYEPLPNDLSAKDTIGTNLVKGGEMDSASDLSYLGVAGAPEIVAATEDDPAPDGSKGYLKLKPKNGEVYWPQISQTMHWQPGHMYHVSFYMRLDTPRDEGKTTATIISDNEGKNTLEMTSAGAWLLQLAGGRIRDINGMNTEYPGKVLYDVVNFDNGWQKVEYYFVHDYKTTASQAFGTLLRLSPNRKKDVMNNASYSLDAFRIIDMGAVSNGDMEAEANGALIYRNQQDTTQTVLGWNGSNATLAYSDDVAEDSEGTKSMKVTVTGAGGAATQILEMKQDSLYKFTFRAKGLNLENPIPFALVLDRNVATRYQYDVWDTPAYEYYTGTHEYHTSYTSDVKENQEWKLTNEWQTYTCYINTSFALLEGKTLDDAKAYHVKSDTDPTLVYEGTTMPRIPSMYLNINNNPVGLEYLIDDVSIEAVNSFPSISNLKVNGKVIPGNEITVSYDYTSATGINDTNTIVRVFSVDENGLRTAIGTFRAVDSYIVPEIAIGKTLEFDVLPIDATYTCGYAVAARAEDAGDWGAILYMEDDYSVRAYAAKDTTATVIFASYAGKELLDAKTVDVTLTANTKADVPVPADFVSAGATEVKVMMWNSLTGTTPLCTPVSK